jgi:uncharacterized protein YbjT (DUF2867 family)
MQERRILVLGGTGFVGSCLCARLVREGLRVRVLTRRPSGSPRLAVLPGLELLSADVHDPAALAEAARGCTAAVNLVGILNPRGRASFELVHAELPRKLALACRSAGIKRLVQISALGASPDAPSEYLRSKAKGEQAIAAQAGPTAWTVLRPSVIFGREDQFVNRFARLLRLSPVLPLAAPRSRFSPVWVDDVVDACFATLNAHGLSATALELGGAEVLTLGEIVRRIAAILGVHRLIVPLPRPLGALQACVLGLLPGKPLTLDNFRSLSVDSVPADDGFARLKLVPVAFSTLLPTLVDERTRADHERERRLLAL